jgi:FtsP/CotA-like multicopper oxidase with cupredoxin domain
MKSLTERIIGRGTLLLGALAIMVIMSAGCNPKFPNGQCPTEYFLRAGTTTKTMPDGTVVTMWGFAQDSSFGALDGTVMVPGPIMAEAMGCSVLIVHMDNNLSEPTSIVINGQTTEMVPVRYPNGRVRSFTQETPPGNTSAVDYVWNNVKPGSFLYMSGTNPAVQVQMGLYGAFGKDAGIKNAYNGVPYDNQTLVILSEIDPVIHAAVASGNYGAGKTVSSTVAYRPQYYLINGDAFREGVTPVESLGNVSKRTLVRFMNAGSKLHSPEFYGQYMQVVAEDGNPYPYPMSIYSLALPAGKTKDVIVIPGQSGIYTLFDRALGLSNGINRPGGGMMRLYQVNL